MSYLNDVRKQINILHFKPNTPRTVDLYVPFLVDSIVIESTYTMDYNAQLASVAMMCSTNLLPAEEFFINTIPEIATSHNIFIVKPATYIFPNPLPINGNYSFKFYDALSLVENTFIEARLIVSFISTKNSL